MTTRETTFRETSFRETNDPGNKPSGKETIRETTVNHAKSCEIPLKFELIAVQGHQRSSILVPVESARVCNFQIVTNSNYRCISYYRFRDTDEKN